MVRNASNDRFHQMRGEKFNQIAGADPGGSGLSSIRSENARGMVDQLLQERGIPVTPGNQEAALRYLQGGRMEGLDMQTSTADDIATQSLAASGGGGGGAPAGPSSPRPQPRPGQPTQPSATPDTPSAAPTIDTDSIGAGWTIPPALLAAGFTAKKINDLRQRAKAGGHAGRNAQLQLEQHDIPLDGEVLDGQQALPREGAAAGTRAAGETIDGTATEIDPNAADRPIDTADIVPPDENGPRFAIDSTAVQPPEAGVVNAQTPGGTTPIMESPARPSDVIVMQPDGTPGVVHAGGTTSNMSPEELQRMTGVTIPPASPQPYGPGGAVGGQGAAVPSGEMDLINEFLRRGARGARP